VAKKVDAVEAATPYKSPNLEVEVLQKCYTAEE